MDLPSLQIEINETRNDESGYEESKKEKSDFVVDKRVDDNNIEKEIIIEGETEGKNNNFVTLENVKQFTVSSELLNQETVEENMGARQTYTCLGVSQSSPSTPMWFWRLQPIYLFQVKSQSRVCLRRYQNPIILFQNQVKYPRPQYTILRGVTIFNPGLPLSFSQMLNSQDRKSQLLITF